LVVDDEQVVLDVVVRMLRRLGYDTVGQRRASAALDYFREHHAEIAFVVLDLSMPEMSGLDCLERLRAVNPAVRVIVSTGFSEDASRLGAIAGFIQKPFQLAELAGLVGSVMAPVSPA
jgi:CheY-like chemotaxis protein